MKKILFALSLGLALTACSRTDQPPPYLRHLECSVNGVVTIRTEAVEQIVLIDDKYSLYQKEYDNQAIGRYRQRPGEYCRVVRSDSTTEQLQ